MTTLRGITWAHSRGYTPLVAAAEAWHDLHPDLAIVWHKRSFWGFGEGPLDEVARDYDLIVYDHPHTGTAARRALFLPLDELAASLGPCAGPSRESYEFENHLYGLPIDAACQSSAFRPDLLDEPPPRDWPAVIALARRTGKVRCSFSPMGALGMFHSLTAGAGAPAGRHSEQYVDREPALAAIQQLQQLFAVCGPASLRQSPAGILGEMASTGTAVYAPLLYGYSNYSREGFAPHRLRFAPPPAGATLGGAGLAISAFTQHRAIAFQFAEWLISPACQRGLYFHAQGQPALREVWESAEANAITHGFFETLLPVIDQAFVRPTYPGYAEFQSRAGQILHSVLLGHLPPIEALNTIDKEYRQSCLAPSSS